MSTPKWTPGPWQWTYDEPHCPDIVDAAGNRVDGLRCWDDDACYDGNPTRHANQQMAAAAPEMYEALEYSLNFIRSICEDKNIPPEDLFFYEEGLAALRKARGES